MEYMKSSEMQVKRVQLTLVSIMLIVFIGVSLTVVLQSQLWVEDWPDAISVFLTSPYIVILAMLAVMVLGAGVYHRLWTSYRMNMDLLSKLEKQHRAVLRFGELSHQMVTKAELSELLELVLQSAMDVCGGDTGSVMLLDESQQYLRIKAAKGIPQEVIDKTVTRLGEGIAGLVAQNGRPTVIGPSTKDPEIAAMMKRQDKIFTAISAPIMLENRVLGTININRADPVLEFEEHDADNLYAFAGQAALSIEKVYLFDRIRDKG